MPRKIKVKFVSKNVINNVINRYQFKELPQQFNEVEFIFDETVRDYDWLAVYDDLPPHEKKRFTLGTKRLTLNTEILPGAPAHSLLITYEPSSIKYYGTDYLNQYGVVLTSHETDMLAHRRRHDVPPVGCWFYDNTLEGVQRHPSPPRKSKMISVFNSNKKTSQTLHAQRFAFLETVKSNLSDILDIYGKGYRIVNKKAEGLDDYRYHIAVENHIGPHHWTEKLSDCFLGYSLPFYAGCSNATDYFPEDSFITIDIRDPEGAVRLIRTAIANNEYERRLPALIEARRRVMEDYNLGNMIARYIVAYHPLEDDMPHQGVILSRHKMMRKSLRHLLRYGLRKVAMRWRVQKKLRRYLAENLR